MQHERELHAWGWGKRYDFFFADAHMIWLVGDVFILKKHENPVGPAFH